MSSQPKVRITPEEYLAIERQAEYKSEYLNGEVFAMAGGTRQHNTITVNVASSLHTQLRKRQCVVYSSDQRVKVIATGLYTYPDVTVLCGDAEFDDGDTLTNPTVIIEVLPKSTAGYDRNEKFAHFRKAPSLAEYVLISQSRPHIELYTRQPDGQWLLSESDDPAASIRLVSIDCSLALSEVYEKVDFET
ncbi:MAG: Uma2 family endonuclease [Acidobacteriota bacterium]|nr:MAG: Uma2 family endonuclease [Acidobacteriota bacterium]